MGRSRGERVVELAAEGRFEEALAEAIVLAGESESPVTLGQVGFLHEQLGQWAQAEEWLRRALAGDPGYVTRYQPVAWYSHTSVSADLHHMLGRVLQRQGEAQEARLHYHLAKRSDPTVELDPIYRDIMSTADLENHPGYDRPDAGPPTGAAEFVEYLLGLRSPEEVRRAAASAPFDEPGQVVAVAAEQMQRQGRFLMAAQLRIVLDAMFADQETARLRWETVGSEHVRRLLDLAEMRQEGTVGAQEADALAAGVAVPPEAAPELMELVWRFVSNDPATGLVIAGVARPALAALGRDAQAAVLVGRAQFGAGHLGAAAATIAAAAAELADDDPWLGEALASLAALNRRLGRDGEATQAERRLKRIAPAQTGGSDPDDLLDHAEALIEDGRTDEALAVLGEVSLAPSGAPMIRRWVLTGNAHAARGEPERVVEAWRTALVLARASSGLLDQWPILMGLGRASLATGDRSAARDYFEAALEQSRDDSAGEREAEALLQLGLLQVEEDPDAAIATVGRSLAMWPEDAGPSKEEEPARLPRRRRWRRPRRSRSTRHAEEESAAALAEIARVGGLLPLDELGLPRTGLDALEAGAIRADIFDLLDGIDDLLEKILPSGKRAHAALVAADLAAHVGDLPRGIGLAQRALKIATVKGRPDLEAEMHARGTLGRLVRLDGDFETARTHFERGVACARTLHDTKGEADLRGRLAITLRFLDLPDLAVEHYAFAVEMAERRGDAATAALNRLNMAQSLILLARPDAAADALQRAVRGFGERGLEDLAGFALRVLAVLLPGQHLAEDVRAALEGLGTEVTSEFASREWTFEHLHIARTLTGRGEHQAAKDALEQMARGLDSAGGAEITILGYVEAARILADADPEHAWELAGRALSAAMSLTSQPRLVTDCHMARLALALTQGWDERIDPLLPLLLADWRLLRRKLSTDAARIALADHMTAHLRPAVARLLQRGQPARAFQLWEALQAPAFTDLLHAVREVPTPEPEPGHDLEPGLRDALADVAGVLALADIGDGVVAFVHRHPYDGPPLAMRTGLSAEDVHGLVKVFRREVHLFHGQGARSWSHLARPLLAAAAPHLPSGGTLMLMLDAGLQELPVHAVPLPDGATLVDRFGLVHAPNLTGFPTLRERAAGAGGHWPRLLTVGTAFPDEARALAIAHGGMCLSGNTLPKDQISRSMAKADIIHFACHGFFDPERPLDSGLLLTTRPSASSRHEILSLRDLITWRSTAAMVTLSACETGLGRPSPADHLGLARSILAAGAASVLVALWKIDDDATQRFMLDFYRELWRTAGDGRLDPAGALSRTQRAWAATRPAQQWAAFRLIGSPTLQNGRAP
ncbi:CHAT domain-containing tetratricopeptide repeat protein [Actinomadura sp. NEAU-AAG7]|uniref:CHAT domain-containing protein n=1 Tax=Actinomadura sp. NEAU-AAG7 TaxID=2839640 RepID=UPI001BE3F2FB|nr:CHAT domain-containing tetratricopeptide repeat protein [Actinomadura sp. NEAU-AAG7]MBT2212581.1 CHAT domain-containing protein [Actinomadura sp. NEAU-AAG7]